MGLPVAKTVALTEVPIIDLGAMRGSDQAARQALAREIAQTCADIGFFYIVNHGISAGRITEMFDAARRFFALPPEARAEVEMSKATHYRGYIPTKTMSQKPQFEASAAELKGNLYDAFQIHPEFAKDDPDVLKGKPLHWQNIWPSAMPDLKPLMERYFTEVSALARQMLKLFALGLDLPETGLDHFFKKALMQLRIIHYPPQPPNDPGENMGLRPHTDSGAFTILAQDQLGGLEILPRGHTEWIQVPPLKDSYVINLGEMMKVWSDGTLQATPHRVINRFGEERYSMPFFMTPEFDAVIKPIVKNPNPSDAPQFATTVASGVTCGQHLLSLYNRIWPVAEK